jgi:hypothetical protein
MGRLRRPLPQGEIDDDCFVSGRTSVMNRSKLHQLVVTLTVLITPAVLTRSATAELIIKLVSRPNPSVVEGNGGTIAYSLVNTSATDTVTILGVHMDFMPLKYNGGGDMHDKPDEPLTFAGADAPILPNIPSPATLSFTSKDDPADGPDLNQGDWLVYPKNINGKLQDYIHYESGFEDFDVSLPSLVPSDPKHPVAEITIRDVNIPEVPEPNTFAFASLGGICVGAYRWRMHRQLRARLSSR